jgi:hypothetical protein
MLHAIGMGKLELSLTRGQVILIGQLFEDGMQ